MTAAALRHRARRSHRPGRARARDAVPLPAARAVRARQHAQRRAARPRGLDRRHRRRPRVRARRRRRMHDAATTTRSRGARRGRRSGPADAGRAPTPCCSFPPAASTARSSSRAATTPTPCGTAGRSRPIGRDEHARWFAAVIDDPGVRLRVGVVHGEPVGTVRVDVRGGVGRGRYRGRARRSAGQGLGTALLEALARRRRRRPAGGRAHRVGARREHAVDARVRPGRVRAPTAPTASSACSAGIAGPHRA